MRLDGFTWYRVANAGRGNATVADSVPGAPGATGVDDLIANVDASLLTAPDGFVQQVMMNWGVNEMTVGDDPGDLPADWEANYQLILEYLHGLWPSAKLYLTYPWRANYTAQPAELHTRIDNILVWAAGEGIPAFAGVDEAVVIEGGDNGATYTRDGVHYSEAGEEIYAATIQTIMGF